MVLSKGVRKSSYKIRRAESVRLSQAARRKRLGLKTVTIEINHRIHANITKVAIDQKKTLQVLLSETLEELSRSSTNARPWEIFGDTLVPESSCKFSHVSLFSGCGGFDLGFRQAGFKTIYAIDNNIDACMTYRRNLGDIVESDIRTAQFPQFIQPPDVLTAGFPCQPFSNAGSRKGLDDHRGTLFQSAIEIVERLKPRAVVFENVRGLLSFKVGSKLLIEEICQVS